MQENNGNSNQPSQADDDKNSQRTNETAPHKHNPFEDKRDTLTKEEEEALEQFKEAQTERD